jgi:very-short-patch-repair endonuclease
MLKDIAPKGKNRSVRNARQLRREMTLPEVLLWQALRQRPGGLKFRRQHPSGVYILDFYCSDARLAIEVDGAAHERGDRPARDERRDDWFRACGITTLRIAAVEVLSDVDAVLQYVVTQARSRLPLHHPAAPGGPPPRDKLGEDL